MADLAIDFRVQRLVQALNAIQGVETFSSCGGHPEPSSAEAQCGEEEFYVCFTVEHNEQGWRALAFISWAAREAEITTRIAKGRDDDTDASLTVWEGAGGDEPKVGSLAFELRGRYLHPNRVVSHLEKLVKET